jgi:hypothetical protein
MKKILLIVSLFTLIVSSCKKDDDPSNTDKLTGKAWKITALKVDPAINSGGTMITDLYAQTADCDKNNTLTFNVDKTYIEDEGATKCNPLDPQTTSGTWAFNSDETVLTQDNTDSYTILQNDGNVLKLSFTEVDAGITYTYTATFGK